MTQTQSNNAELLLQIIDSGCRLPTGTDPLAFCLALVENFRSTDARLRDRLSYSLLARLLTEFHVVHDTICSVLSYAREERDRRGYIDGKGWAHTIAHTADALDSCAQHPFATESERLDVLHCVADLASVASPIYFHEDDRLAFTASQIIKKGWISSDALEHWLGRFVKPEGPEPEDTIQLANLEHFLRSLYFLLKWKQVASELIEKIDERLRALSWYVQANVL